VRRFVVVALWIEQDEYGAYVGGEIPMGRGYETFSEAMASCRQEQRESDGRYTFQVREVL
jgi:hypothetical protein